MAPRPGRLLVALVPALIAALAFAHPAHAISIAPETPRSPNAEGIATAYWVMLAIAALLVVAVHAALAVALLRFRARRGIRPPRTTAGRGALRPAVGGFAALALAVLVFGLIVTADVRSVEPTGSEGLDPAQERTAQVGISDVPSGDEEGEPAPLEIDAIAQRWAWRFEYPRHEPGQSKFSYGELVVPVDTAVVLNVTSIDVAHSFWVPALGGQVQALPGKTTETWFKASEEGRYAGNSTIFSGTGYPSVRIWVRVVDTPSYLAYIEQLEAELDEAQAEAAAEAAAEAETAERSAEDGGAEEEGDGEGQGPGAGRQGAAGEQAGEEDGS